jgi:predicted HicB family RNase H-like nuclease
MTRLATDVVREMETGGETPPVPLATRSYSGKFMVRVPPETHRALLLAASEQGVSLNSLATARLAGTAGG